MTASSVQVESVDAKAASLYVALTVPQEEIEREGYANLVPKRKVTRGRKPTIRTRLISGPLPRESRNIKVPETTPQATGLEDVEWERGVVSSYIEVTKQSLIMCLKVRLCVGFESIIHQR